MATGKGDQTVATVTTGAMEATVATVAAVAAGKRDTDRGRQRQTEAGRGRQRHTKGTQRQTHRDMHTDTHTTSTTADRHRQGILGVQSGNFMTKPNGAVERLNGPLCERSDRGNKNEQTL